MTVLDKINIVKTLLQDSTISDEIACAFLESAGDAILSKAYPFGTRPEEVPEKYNMLQCRLAVRYIARIGAEGESSHNENGVNRTYGSTNDEDLLSEVMQVVMLR